MRILISAAETSSDIHGAELLLALKKQLPPGTELDAFGIGGPKLQEAGLRMVVDARELLSMGFSEVIGRLPRILRALKNITNAARETPPDIAVVLDYPDFHFRLARALKKQKVPVIYYIPPKVWVWRKARVRLLRELFVKVLCIFPFEQEFYDRAEIPAKYVGNPLMDELPFDLIRSEARLRLGLGQGDPVLLLMPGSRPAELKRHVAPMLEGAIRAAAKMRSTGKLGAKDPLSVVVALPLTVSLEMIKARVGVWLEANPQHILTVKIVQGQTSEALIAADAALVKSGTSTLEAALLGCPHAVVYKPSFVSGWIFQNLVAYRGPVGLVNMALGWKQGDPMIAREILCGDVTPEKLGDEAYSLLTQSDRRERMIGELAVLKSKIADQRGARLGPSALAAQEVLAQLKIGDRVGR